MSARAAFLESANLPMANLPKLVFLGTWLIWNSCCYHRNFDSYEQCNGFGHTWDSQDNILGLYYFLHVHPERSKRFTSLHCYPHVKYTRRGWQGPPNTPSLASLPLSLGPTSLDKSTSSDCCCGQEQKMTEAIEFHHVWGPSCSQ